MRSFLLLIIILFASKAYSQNDTVTNPPLQGWPVVVQNDTVFVIYLSIGNMKPQERASRIAEKIEQLAERRILFPDSVSIYTSDVSLDIGYNDFIICSVFEAEAKYENITIEELTQKRLQAVKTVLIKAHHDLSVTKLIMRLAILAALFLLIYLVIRYFSVVQNFLKRKFFLWFEKLPINQRLIAANATYRNKQQKIFDLLFKIIYYGLLLFLVYISLPVVFRIFPKTKPWSDLIINHIINPVRNIINATIDYIPNLITIIVIYFVFRFISRMFKLIAKEIAVGHFSWPGFHTDWAMPSFNLIRFVLYVFFCIIIFPYLPGSDSQVFRGFTVFFGLLISIGSSSSISNVLSGFVITYMRPFLIGDRIKLGDTTGDVVEKTLLVTRIKTIKNEIISVPNQFVMAGNTINYSTMAREGQLILYTSVTIGYDAPWQTVHNLLITAALETQGIISHPKPFVLQIALNDFYVEYQINAYTNNAQVMAETYSNLHTKIQDKFNEAGVEIMSPHYSSLRDGNAIAIPDANKPQNYQSPPFKVRNTNA